MRNLLDTSDKIDRRVRAAGIPLIGGIAVTAATLGVLNYCCNRTARKANAGGALPIGLAVLTAGVALWSYFNPEAIRHARK